MTNETMTPFFICMTTIQTPTASVRVLHERMRASGGRMVVAGDRKGPAEFSLENVEFLGFDEQMSSGDPFAQALPVGHYARKNLAYLRAIGDGAPCIYETDDDNTPLSTWQLPQLNVGRARVLQETSTPRWVNAYRYFTDDPQIWPRGLPLDAVNISPPVLSSCGSDARRAPVQQSLVNGSPDVDAIWRLTQDRPFEFGNRFPVFLGSGNWMPFNTQCTWWWPEAYPLLYIPSYCSFRMCDIWKSFVAQRCLWAMDTGLLLLAPQVVQDRNPHDLMRDFEDEVSGYLSNRKIANILDALELQPGVDRVCSNLLSCYEALVREAIFPVEELDLLNLWLGNFA